METRTSVPARARTARCALVTAIAIAASACSYTLPEPIYANQVEEHFPEPAADAPDAEPQRAIREEARQCAARLNGHRGAAEVSGILQATVSGVGSLSGGVGGVLSAIDFGNPDITTAMGVMAAIGSGVTLVGNFLLGFFANPTEELRLQAQGYRSWELAIELRYANGDPAAIQASLTRCRQDQGPPVRTPGSGPAFSL